MNSSTEQIEKLESQLRRADAARKAIDREHSEAISALQAQLTTTTAEAAAMREAWIEERNRMLYTFRRMSHLLDGYHNDADLATHAKRFAVNAVHALEQELPTTSGRDLLAEVERLRAKLAAHEASGLGRNGPAPPLPAFVRGTLTDKVTEAMGEGRE
jgi:hypothetical protein